LGGLLGKERTQTAYAKVSRTVVNVKTSESIYAVQGAGEYQLSHKEVLGFGGTAGYDATLNDKVLNLAIMEAVQKLVDSLEKKAWRPEASQ
jgi:curli biogenesis system outer membrane secretion channel CsgG